MSEPYETNHHGVWTVETPADMTITVIAMLQATIKEAWESYGGDPMNAEQFWNHLVDNGAADVPRETSPPRHPVPGETWQVIDDPDDKVEIISVGGADRFGPAPVTYRHTNCRCGMKVHALKNHQSVRPMPSFLGLYVPDGNVPRET